MEALRQVDAKPDVILVRLRALEGTLRIEDPGDGDAYLEAEAEQKKGGLKPFKRS